MKLNVPQDLSNVGTGDDMTRFVSQSLKQVISALNGGISFSDNMDLKMISVVFSAGNVNVATQHSLGRAPAGYIVTGLSSGIIVFDGTTANTDSVINLQASAAGAAELLIF